MYWLNPLGDLVPQWYSITRHLQYTKQVLKVFNIPYARINQRGKHRLQQFSLNQEYCYNEHYVLPLELWVGKQGRKKFLTLLRGENFHFRLGDLSCCQGVVKFWVCISVRRKELPAVHCDSPTAPWTFELGSPWDLCCWMFHLRKQFYFHAGQVKTSNKALRLTSMLLLEPVALTALRIKFLLLQTEEMDSGSLRGNKCESTGIFSPISIAQPFHSLK